MVVHATATLGAPNNLIQRLGFFASITYNIGGQVYSCDEIEHGVLRANAVSPAAIATLLGYPNLAPRTFSEKDQRRLVTVYPMDPRIHFALVCGAKSCPPIKVSGHNVLGEVECMPTALIHQNSVPIYFRVGVRGCDVRDRSTGCCTGIL